MIKNTTVYTEELMEKVNRKALLLIVIVMDAMFLIIGGILAVINFAEADNVSAISYIVVFAIVIILVPILFAKLMKSTARKNINGPSVVDKYSTHNFAFDESFMYGQTVREDIEISRSTVPYNLLCKCVVNNDFIQIFQTVNTHIIVSRAGMTDGSYEDLAELLSRCMAGKFVSKLKKPSAKD